MTVQTVNPATSQEIATYTTHSQEHLVDLLERTQHVWETMWRTISYVERIKPILKFADLLEQQSARLATIMAQEMGKPITEGLAEIKKSAAVCRAVAARADEYFQVQIHQDFDLDHDDVQVNIMIAPTGTLFMVMPWNYPIWQVIRVAIPNLVGGNTVLLKHASSVTGCALAIQELFAQAGIPEHVFTTLVIPHSLTETVIAHPSVSGVTLTGSCAAGRTVAALAGKHLKKSVMELGGSDPFIVLDDADLDLAVEEAFKSRFGNCGQSCIAAKRMIVHQAIHQAFVRRLVARVQEATVGDPLSINTTHGPMSSVALRDDLHAQVEAGLRHGGTLLVGGTIPDGPGAFYPLTVIDNVQPDNPLAQEEVFGPVAVILVAQDGEEAIEIANNTPFGLGGAIFTHELGMVTSAMHHLHAGMLSINTMNASHPIVPFGGTKQSGYGRELGPWGALEFMNIKAISHLL